jgi:uncharacterized protein (DUF1919 family)
LEEATKAWDRRKRRIDSSKLFFIFMVYDNTPDEVIRDFESLPMKNRIVITNKTREEFHSSIALLNGEESWHGFNARTQKPHYQSFDYYTWIRKGLRAQRCLSRKN